MKKTLSFLIFSGILIFSQGTVRGENPGPYFEIERGIWDICSDLANEAYLPSDLSDAGCFNAVLYYLYGDTSRQAAQLSLLIVPGAEIPFPVDGVTYPQPTEGLGAYFASPNPVFSKE